MATTPDELYVKKFNALLVLLAQQLRTRLRGTTMETKGEGENMSPVDQLGKTRPKQRQARFENKVYTDRDHFRRWVAPISWYDAELVDKFDKIRSAVELNSGYMKGQMAGLAVEIDQAILDATFASASTGKLGTDSTAFPGGDFTIAAGGTDLTVAKLLQAQQVLYQNEVDLDDPEEMITCVISPHQHTTLINSQEINNADFGNTVFDKAGRLTFWFGIHFRISNNLGVTSGTSTPGDAATREVPFYAKSGMNLSMWDDIRGTIQKQVVKVDDPWEIATYATFGATRLEETKVVKIVCDET